MLEQLGLGGLSTMFSAGGAVGTIANIFAIVLMFVIVGGSVFGVLWFINNKIWVFNIPVTLDFQVGDTIQEKRDKIRIQRSKDNTWKVSFQKNSKLLAEIPPDECGYFVQSGLKSIKGFRGFVRDGQVAWCWPSPQTKVIITDDEGKPVAEHERFTTIETNLREYHIQESRRNQELSNKLKWWQNPVLLSYAAMGFMVIALIFIYLLYKSVPDQINAYISFATTKCQGVLVK
jgi:hypothetical protein